MDKRPADGKLYMLTHDLGVTRLWTVDSSTGEAKFVGNLAADPADSTSPYTSLNTAQGLGIDFNPTSDRLRVVSGSAENIRVNPDTALVTTDTNLNPGSPVVTGVGYSNSFAGSATTTLYGYDYASDTMVIQNPPNNGTLSTVGSSGIVIGDSRTLGLDIAYPGNIAYLGGTVFGVYNLYILNLSTGAATLIEPIAGGSTTIIDIAVTPDPAPASPPPPAAPAPSPQPETTAPTTSIGSPKLSNHGVVSATLGCPATETSCTFSYKLASAKPVRIFRRRPLRKIITLGSGETSASGGKSATIKIRLSKRNRNLIKRRGKLGVNLTVIATDAAGNKAAATRRETLRVSKKKRR
jgi:hypothetical protein